MNPPPSSAVHGPYSAQPAIRYDGLTRMLHWGIAAIIIYVMATGYLLPLLVGTILFKFVSVLNMSLGTLITPLMAVRYVWKFFRPALPYPADLSKTKQNAAHLAHELFYLVIWTMLVSGFLMLTHGYQLFWLIPIPQFVHNADINQFFFAVHRYACIAVTAMLTLHIAAVAKHHLIDKRDVLRRMC